jgi:predicted dehydrogenase/threonine dehydrogenase-like Zn-dependent dehydrogenase
MKQLVQRYDSGELRLTEVPVPAATDVQIVVESRASVISAGTERATVELARANLIEKARKRPDQVRQVLDKLRTHGFAATLETVRARLGEPVPLGYCCAGVVVDVGPRARGFAPGDRVATNGPHSEYVRVPHTLAARIPPGVDFDAAAMTPLAAIALHGIRLASPTLGETVVVYGLGLIGLLTVQLLRAHGCRVIGIDRDDARLQLAARFGAVPVAAADDAVERVIAETGGIGADAVLLTLAARSDEPVHHAAAMSRKRGRLVLVGVTGLALRREDFYHKELSFTVSCSYGPGRYDPVYEAQGNDYPIGFVRWTQQRNFEAVLHLMATGALDPRPLITHRFPFERAGEAYDVITTAGAGLGVVLEYPVRNAIPPDRAARTIELGGPAPAVTTATPDPRPAQRAAVPARAVAAFVGTGAFATGTLIPAARAAGFTLRTAVSLSGTSAALAAGRLGFAHASTDLDAVLEDDAIDTVFVATRHDSHARLALRALEAGKHVFVEKPLALTAADLDALEAAAAPGTPLLTVGFNRRFAPLARELGADVQRRLGPLALVVIVNAGAVAEGHWTVDREQGGGRIAGEACHFVDLSRALVGAPIVGGSALPARRADGRAIEDVAHLTLAFGDGSIAAIHYLSASGRAFPKERIEAFGDGRVLVIEDWRRLRRYPGGFTFRWPRRRDKGHAAELAAWAAAVRAGGPAPIPLEQLFEVSRWTLRLAEMART